MMTILRKYEVDSSIKTTTPSVTSKIETQSRTWAAVVALNCVRNTVKHQSYITPQSLYQTAVAINLHRGCKCHGIRNCVPCKTADGLLGRIMKSAHVYNTQKYSKIVAALRREREKLHFKKQNKRGHGIGPQSGFFRADSSGNEMSDDDEFNPAGNMPPPIPRLSINISDADSELSETSSLLRDLQTAFSDGLTDIADRATVKRLYECFSGIMWFVLYDWPKASGKAESILVVLRLVQSLVGIDRTVDSFTWILDMFKKEVQPQAGLEDAMKWMHENGSDVKTGEAAHKTKKFMCALISMAFSGIFSRPISAGWYEKVWAAAHLAWKETNIIGTVFEFALWFIRSAKAWITGDKTLSQIFTDADKAADFDTRVARLDSMRALLCAGDEKVSLMMYSAEVLVLKRQAEVALRTAPRAYRMVLDRQYRHILLHDTYRRSLEDGEAYREAPASFGFVGGSGVGKTCMIAMVAQHIQHAAGVDEGPQHVFTLDGDDPYMSGFGPGYNVIVSDDMGNTVAQYAKQAASQQVIDIVNNQPRMAIMADLSEKGIYAIRPVGYIGTSNDEFFGCHETSVEPLSILRRFAWHYKVELKPSTEWVDNGKLKTGVDPAHYGYDIWKITKYRWHKRGPGVKDLEKVDIKVMSFPEVLLDIAQYTKLHLAAQRKFVQNMANMRNAKFCEHGTYQFLCKHQSCVPLPESEAATADLAPRVETQMKREIGKLAAAHMKWLKSCFSGDRHEQFEMEDQRSARMAEVREAVYMEPSRIMAKVGRLAQAAFILRELKKPVPGYGVAIISGFEIILIYLARMFFGVACGVSVFTTVNFIATIAFIAARAIPIIRVGPNKCVQDLVVMELSRPHRKKQLKVLAATTAAITAAYVVYKVWCKSRKMVEQGAEHSRPTPAGTSNTKNVYKEQYIRPVIKNDKAVTMTADQLGETLSSHLLVGRFMQNMDDDQGYVCNVFPVESEHLLVPYHVIRLGHKWLCLHHADHTKANSFKWVSIGENWRKIPDSDMAILYSPVVADRKDFTDMFMDGLTLHNSAVRVVWVDSQMVDGKPSKRTFEVQKGVSNATTSTIKVPTLDYTYSGGAYTFPGATRAGLCGAPIISDKVSGPAIVGFHSAGVTGSNVARFTRVTRSSYNMAKEALHMHDLVEQSQMHERHDHSVDLDFPDTVWRWKDRNNDQSTSRWVAGEYEQLGANTAPSRTLRSNVEVTDWSQMLDEKYKMPREHEKPRNIGSWIPWNMWLTNSTDPSRVPVDFVSLAQRDYANMLSAGLSDEMLQKKISPLDHMSTINGVNGVLGCDAMKKSTSMGIPWCRPKKEYLVPTMLPEDNIEDPHDFTPEINKAIKALEERLASGVRANVPHRCNLKDEAVKIGKEKVRVFLGCPVPYLYLMRKFFLPISMLIQENPKLFETAVGTNCYGHQWTELAKHISKYGAGRIIAGDYAKYDQKMEIALTKAAFEIILWLCKRAGYSDRDMTICRGLMTETIAGCYDVRGEWIGLTGGNPSGHALTVIINSIVNSLYMRCVFFALLPPGENRSFAELVSLMTYGDDNIASVSADAPWYTHTTVSKKFAEWNMQYTMADKTAESVDYIHLKDATFLKRAFKEVDGVYLAPLEESSIMKTLHTYVRSREMDAKEQHAQLLMNANREYFMYGPEVFEEKRAMLMDLATTYNVAHFLPHMQLDTYEQASAWFARQ